MGNEEAVSTYTNRQVHIGLLGDYICLQYHVEKILWVFGMKYQHPGIGQPANFNIVRLDGQRRIHSSGHKGTDYGQPFSCPAGEHFKCSQRARSRGCGKCPYSPHCRPGHSRHDVEFILASIIVLDITLGINISDNVSSLTLWCNRVGNHHINVGPLHGLGNGFISDQILLPSRGLKEHILGAYYFPFWHDNLPILTFLIVSVRSITSSA